MQSFSCQIKLIVVISSFSLPQWVCKWKASIKTSSHISCLCNRMRKMKKTNKFHSFPVVGVGEGHWGCLWVQECVCCWQCMCVWSGADMWGVCMYQEWVRMAVYSQRWWGENDEAHSSITAPCVAHMLGLSFFLQVAHHNLKTKLSQAHTYIFRTYAIPHCLFYIHILYQHPPHACRHRVIDTLQIVLRSMVKWHHTH